MDKSKHPILGNKLGQEYINSDGDTYIDMSDISGQKECNDMNHFSKSKNDNANIAIGCTILIVVVLIIAYFMGWIN